MTNISSEHEIFLVLTLDFRLHGLIDFGSGKKFTHAFTSLDRLQDFIQAQKERGAVNFTQYRALPTTFDEYYNRGLKEKLGGLDLTLNPAADIVDGPGEIGELGLN